MAGQAKGLLSREPASSSRRTNVRDSTMSETLYNEWQTSDPEHGGERIGDNNEPRSARGRGENAAAKCISGGVGDEHGGPHPRHPSCSQKLQTKRRGVVFQRVISVLVCEFAGMVRNLTTTPGAPACAPAGEPAMRAAAVRRTCKEATVSGCTDVVRNTHSSAKLHFQTSARCQPRLVRRHPSDGRSQSP
jgi:hypothetical protein